MDTPRRAVTRMRSMGLTCKEISEQLAERLGISYHEKGVLRVSYGENDPAYTVGAALIELAAQLEKDRRQSA